MNAHIKARNSPSVVRSAGRASNGRTICASTDVVNACGGEGDGVSTIQAQRSLLHNRRCPLQLNKGLRIFEVVKTYATNEIIITILELILSHNSIRASSLTPPEWENAIWF